MSTFIDNWTIILLVFGGIILMNILIGKSKSSKDELRKRREKIKRRNQDF